MWLFFFINRFTGKSLIVLQLYDCSDLGICKITNYEFNYRAILKGLYSVIVSIVHYMPKDNCCCITNDILQVPVEHPKATPQAMGTENSNPSS